MLNEATDKKLSAMYDELSHTDPAGYPDPLDLLALLQDHPNLDETIDFWEFRKAYDWLSEMVQRNHWRGRHGFVDHRVLAARAGCSDAVLIAAATQLGLKARRAGGYTAFKVPPEI